MDDLTNQEQAVDLLQQLGLKEYEAKSFVALTRLPAGTAREVSELSSVPRTRVYDAIRVLESKGLVEVQHSNPQKFRAVPVDEAVGTLRNTYESRVEALREMLRNLTPAEFGDETDVTHEIWSLSGRAAIENRAVQLIEESDSEAILVLNRPEVLTDSLIDALSAAQGRGVDVIVGTRTDDLRISTEEAIPGADVFVSGLEWLVGASEGDDETEISRLLLIDRGTILVGSIHDGVGDGQVHEQAVFGRGFDNGLVVIVRRLMSTGLLSPDEVA